MKLKRIFAAVTAFALCASLAGCGAPPLSASPLRNPWPSPPWSLPLNPPSRTAACHRRLLPDTDAAEAALRIAGLKGPTTMGLVNLMTDEVAAELQLHDVRCCRRDRARCWSRASMDAAAVPANLAATLYNKTNGAVEVACINTLGVLYIVENGETVNCGRGPEGPDHRHHRQGQPRLSTSCAMS